MRHAHKVFSAGTQVLNDDEKKLIDQDILKILMEIGIDASHHRRTQLREDFITDMDKIIVVMAERDAVPEFLRKRRDVIYWDIPDPKGGSLEDHRRVRDVIEKHVSIFIEENDF